MRLFGLMLQQRLAHRRRPLHAPLRRGLIEEIFIETQPFWYQSAARKALLLREAHRRSGARRHRFCRRVCQCPAAQLPQPRQWRVRPLFAARPRYGAWHVIVPLMMAEDVTKFFNYVRMTPQTFAELLARVGPDLQRRPLEGYLCPAERLTLTLRYLASGDSMVSISYQFLVGQSTVSAVILDTCQVLWDVLSQEVFRPLSEELWMDVARGFWEQWDFPNCIGALDGRHCVVQNFPQGGTNWRNYKGSFSMVLLAMCDANYKFTYVNAGGRGRRSDGGLFHRSELGERLQTGNLQVPPPATPPGGAVPIPHMIVADDAFGLTPNVMTPFKGELLPDECNIFNYRLSRARRTIENAFGIMTARWRVLRRTLLASKRTARAIILAVVCLHNLLILGEDHLPAEARRYIPEGLADREDGVEDLPGEWRGEVHAEDGPQPIEIVGEAEAYAMGVEAREDLVDFFLGPGAVRWQWSHMLRR